MTCKMGGFPNVSVIYRSKRVFFCSKCLFFTYVYILISSGSRRLWEPRRVAATSAARRQYFAKNVGEKWAFLTENCLKMTKIWLKLLVLPKHYFFQPFSAQITHFSFLKVLFDWKYSSLAGAMERAAARGHMDEKYRKNRCCQPGGINVKML